jgi:hypothetical protein
MPTAVDLTVKKNDGTTDIVYNVVAASGGDKAPAVFRCNAATGTLGQKPVLSVSARSNAAGTVRRVDISGSFPSVYTNTGTGQTEVRSIMSFQASFAVPQNVATADMNEFSAQMCNLLANATIKSAIATGFAPT